MDAEQQQFLFVGNHPCLDFINTQMIVRGELTDLLKNFESLASWLVQAKLLTRSQSDIVKKGVGRTEAASLLEQAKQLRTTLRGVVERIAARKAVSDSAIDTINEFLSQRPGYPQLIWTTRGFEQCFQALGTDAQHLLVPLAEAASNLLCLTDFDLIKKCRNEACILYFYDTTKNHGRNWCSMQLCGNRMKVAAYFQRQRKRA